jgi:hypothetical protein
MESFFDGTDQENSKTQGGKGQIRKNSKERERKKEWRKEKEEIVTYNQTSLTYIHTYIRIGRSPVNTSAHSSKNVGPNENYMVP